MMNYFIVIPLAFFCLSYLRFMLCSKPRDNRLVRGHASYPSGDSRLTKKEAEEIINTEKKRIAQQMMSFAEKPFKSTGIYTKSQAAKVVGSPYFVSDGRTYYVGVPGAHGCSGVGTGVGTTDIKFCPKCNAYMNHGTSNGSTTTIYCFECDYNETTYEKT